MSKVSLASLADEPVEDVPGVSQPLFVRLSVADIATTPLNPRSNFGSDDELNELGESLKVRQLQPIVVVSRSSYLKIAPEHSDQIGAVSYVLVNGERRLRAAQHVGLEGLDAVIRDEIAESRTALLDAVLTENIDRKNFDPIEEARAVEAMVQQCGNANLAAEHWRKSKGWISQRRALLRLDERLQRLVITGEMPLRFARSLVELAPDEQVAKWQQSHEQPTAPVVAQRKIDQPQADLASAEDVNVTVPVQRPQITKAPTAKTASKVLGQYKNAYGLESMATLVLEELAEAETLEFFTAAAKQMPQSIWDQLIATRSEPAYPAP